MLGTTAYEKIVEAVDEALAGSRGVEEKPLSYLPQTDAKRMVTTGGHYAYLKIAEGCNKCCTYCIIPKLRGRYRSVPMERLIEQAKELAAQGVKELILCLRLFLLFKQIADIRLRILLLQTVELLDPHLNADQARQICQSIQNQTDPDVENHILLFLKWIAQQYDAKRADQNRTDQHQIPFGKT